MVLQIENREGDILSSNFWDSEYAKRGAFFLSINAGAARLLIPDNRISEVKEMETGKLVILSRGPWPEGRKKEAIEILFEDYSEASYSMHLGSEQVDRLLPPSDNGKDIIFSAWTRGAVKLFERPGKFRTVRRLPWLKPWE